ncbi:MAG: molybdate ABC transporter permease subunit [Psychroserpens sp.]|nr:molybdate ABC transporter permease subunit [Psychroserpens sp.]
MEFDLQPILLSFKLALITCVFLLVVGIPIAYFLASTKSKFKFFFEAFLSLPLVLPPSVLGFYLLVALAPDSLVGGIINSIFNIKLVFSFEGIVLASVIYSFPFMVQPIQVALEKLPKSIVEASYTLGKNKFNTFLHILLPNVKPAILLGSVLSFAHTVGEFGVVLMIGGNIPGETRVASLAVYDEVESLNYDSAHFYSLILLVSSFVIITFVYWVNKKNKLTITS